jgi:hypothetical protein
MVGAQSASDPYIAEDLHMTADLIESTVNFQSMESWSSEDTAYSWASTALTAVDDDGGEISPASSIPAVPDLDKSKILLSGTGSLADETYFVATLPVAKPADEAVSLRAEMYLDKEMVVGIERTCSSPPKPVDSAGMNNLETVPAPLETISSNPKYACPLCDLTFRTPGTRR